MKEQKLLIDLQYCPPIAYFSLLRQYDLVSFEACESFLKSTYRNRMQILGPNGVQSLSIPIEGGRSHKQIFRDVKIDNGQKWQHEHWNSIRAAYGRSPYFEHYAPELECFYEKEWTFLLDYNRDLLDVLLQYLEIDLEFEFTTQFEKATSDEIADYRSVIHPNPRKDLSTDFYKPQSYLQVFSDRFEFQPNLSILDLIFNEGPNANSYL